MKRIFILMADSPSAPFCEMVFANTVHVGQDRSVFAVIDSADIDRVYSRFTDHLE